MERHILVVQAALQLRDELAGLLGDEHATSWAELDAVLAQALQRAIEEPGPATLKSLLAAARSHPLTAARMAELLGGQWRNAAPAATAATSPGPGVADSAPAGFEKVEVLYATNRAAGNGKRPEEAYGALLAADNRLALGRCIVTLPSKRARGELPSRGLLDLLRGEDPARHVIVTSVETLQEPGFAAALTDTPCTQALVFLHGYNVSFGDAMRRTAQLKFDLGYKAVGPVIGFSWPSRASFLNYGADVIAASRTAPVLAEFLLRLQSWAPGLRNQVVAHSVGNLVLALAMRELELSGRAARARVQQLILAAPDIDRGVFEDLAGALRSSAERVTLYASANDRALWLSKLLQGGPRAGDASGGVVVVDGVDTVDASRTDSSLLAMNHSSFAGRLSLLSDIRESLLHGTPVGQRPGMWAAPSGRHWLLQP